MLQEIFDDILEFLLGPSFTTNHLLALILFVIVGIWIYLILKRK